MIQTILIDDEIIGLDSMKHLIEKYCPELSVRAACQTPEEGIAAIENLNPILSFLIFKCLTCLVLICCKR